MNISRTLRAHKRMGIVQKRPGYPHTPSLTYLCGKQPNRRHGGHTVPCISRKRRRFIHLNHLHLPLFTSTRKLDRLELKLAERKPD